jgi:putative copper resistance protein D
MRSTRQWRPLIGVLAGLAGWLAAATAVVAHGAAPSEPPTAASLLLGWTFEPLPTLAIGAATGWWFWAVGRVRAAHPANPVPRQRTWAFLAGMTAIAFALLSGIDRYDTTLFSVHMTQHVLLILVSAPLLALAAPVTLLLRVSSPLTRRRWLLPFLHSRLVRILSHPVVSWLAMALVMWGSHFTPLFDAALEDPLIHDLEHALFLTAAILFWWPVVARDPAPSRMGHPGRLADVFIQMTQNTFLAVVILGAPTVLYRHYATLSLAWPSDSLADQKLAAGIMWIAGDAIFIGALMALMFGWMRSEERATARADREAAQDLGAIRVREQRLADRLAEERGEGG